MKQATKDGVILSYSLNHCKKAICDRFIANKFFILFEIDDYHHISQIVLRGNSSHPQLQN